MTYFAQTRQDIASYLHRFLDTQAPDVMPVNAWGPDVIGRYKSFLTGGKMVRGGLVLLSAEMFGYPSRDEALKAAAALELMHAALLIHDDIMDQDRLRRGAPTLFAQYEAVGQERQMHDAGHFGASMAICAGDIGFFWGFQLLMELSDPSRAQAVCHAFAREMTRVGLAQMADVTAGMDHTPLTEADIMAVYRYKTAGYTFSLPLMAGAMLTGQKAVVLHQLDELGEQLGLLFQLKDDALGLFGQTVQTGKPVGSDIRSGKQTLYYFHLFDRVTEAEREQLAAIFGNATSDEDMMQTVLAALHQHGVVDTVEETMTRLEASARTAVAQLPLDQRYRDILGELVDFSVHRTV